MTRAIGVVLALALGCAAVSPRPAASVVTHCDGPTRVSEYRAADGRVVATVLEWDAPGCAGKEK